MRPGRAAGLGARLGPGLGPVLGPVLGLVLGLTLSLALPAGEPPSAVGSCEARELHRTEVTHRLRQVQRYLFDTAHGGFAYDLGRAAGAVDEVFAAAAGTETCGDGWWNPVAAAALHHLSRFTALDPAGEREEWLQESYDALAVAIAFEALTHEEEREVARAFEILDRPRERDRVVALWSRLRRSFRGNLEHPRTAELQALVRRAEGGEAPRPAPPEGPYVLAHQGGSLRWPPNTLAAFGQARRLGADGVECDLRLSRDGEVYVLHDDRLVDPAGGRVSVRESTAATLERLFLLDPSGLHRASSEHPLALRDLLRAWPADAFLWLELKPDGGEHLADRVGDLLAERGAANRKVVVASLSGEALAPLRRRFPDLLVAYESIDVNRATVEAHAASADAHRLIVSVQHFAARAPEALRRAQELGLRTSSFTPNRFDDLERALSAGIDFIQTDRPDRALWLRGRGAATRDEPVPPPVR